MKIRLLAALLGALIIAADAAAQTGPPPIIVQVPPAPPSAPTITQRDGPYHLLLHARLDAHERRVHGLHADVVEEHGLWYVVFYP